MISTRSRVGCGACAFAIAALRFNSTFAEDFEQRAAHEHGKVTLNVAVDGNKLHVVLEAPAINVIGFEHAPQSEAERAAATRSQARLQSGIGLIGVPQAAQCRLEHAHVEAPAWSSRDASVSSAQSTVLSGTIATRESADQELQAWRTPHERPEDSHAARAAEHERHSEHGQHSEYTATLTYVCRTPERLTWFEPWLLDKLHDVIEARVNLSGPRGQRSEIVGRARARVAL